MEKERQVHNIPPVYDARSRVLILGSFPSVRSRREAFFYAHPQNRFWPVLAALLDAPPPQTTEEKRVLVLSGGIALWDAVGACSIAGSSDASITDVVPNDLSVILNAADIRAVFCNGATAFRLYCRYQQPLTGIPAVQLPSTSPANAAFSLARLTACWQPVRDALDAATGDV